MNKKLFALVVLLFSVFSCKDTYRMPTLDTEDKTETFDTPNLDVDGPKVELGVDMVLSVGDKNKSRAMTLDLVDVNHNNGIQKNVNVRWVNGEKYTILACIRYRDENQQNNTKAVYSTIEGTVYDASADNHSGKMKLSGTFSIPTAYFSNSTSGSLELDDKDNWFFAGIFVSRKTVDGKIEKMGEISTDGEKVILKNANPSKLIAVKHLDKSFDMDVPLCIPFQHVIINSKDDFAPKPGVDFTARPLGTVVNFRLKNNLSRTIYLKLEDTYRVKVKSRLIFNKDITVDFWQYGDRLKHFGTKDFEFHYDNEGGRSIFDEQGKMTAELGIEQESFQRVFKGVEGRGVTLYPGNYIDLYTWTIENVNYPDHAALYDASKHESGASIDVVYYKEESMELHIEELRRSNNVNSLVYGQNWGVLSTWGYGAEELNGAVKDGEKHNLNYFEFNSKSKPHFAGGKVYTIPMNIQSDLIISRVYSEWHNSSKQEPGLNKSLIEIYNPNNEPIDLENYYLARIIYGKDRTYPFTKYGKANRGNILFRSTWYNDSPKPQYAALMPLKITSAEQVGGLTAAGVKANTYLYNDYNISDLNNSGSGKSHWDGAFKTYIKSIKGNGQTLSEKVNNGSFNVYGAYGIYKDESILDGGYFGTDVINNAKKWATEHNNGVPQFFGVYDISVSVNSTDHNVPQDKPEDVSTDDNNRSKFSGVMSNAPGQGWVLFKRIGDKFYILDTFGPAIEEGIIDATMYSPDSFMNILKGNSVHTALRKGSHYTFPCGSYMYKEHWRIGAKNLRKRSGFGTPSF